VGGLTTAGLETSATCFSTERASAREESAFWLFSAASETTPFQSAISETSSPVPQETKWP
jgi:hypothetical protein